MVDGDADADGSERDSDMSGKEYNRETGGVLK